MRPTSSTSKGKPVENNAHASPWTTCCVKSVPCNGFELFFVGNLHSLSGLGMATSGESSVDPVKEETPKETPEPSTAEGEQQQDAGKEEVTPKATSEAETAGGDTQQKEEASESRPKSASPEPELGKRPSTQECKRIFKQVV